MMEDVQGALSPIIQAMIASHQQTLAQNQQEIEKQKNKEDQKNRQEQLKQAQKALEYQHEHELAQIAVQQKLAEAEAESRHASTMLSHQQFVHAGGDYKSVLPPDTLEKIAPGLSKKMQNGTAHEMMFSPLSESSPLQPSQALSAAPNPYGSAEEASRIQAQAAGMKAGAISDAQLPAEQALANTNFQNTQTLQNSRIESEKAIVGRHINSAEQIARLSRASQERMNSAINATRLQAMGMDPNTNKGMVQSMYLGALTGDYKLNPSVNPLERIVYDQVQKSGGHMVDPKEALGLRESQKLLPIFDKLEELAKSFPTGPGGAFVQGHTTSVANALGIPTNLQNKITIINSQAMNVGKTTEGITGRPLATQLKLDLDSLASPGITKAQFIERINNLRGNYVNNQQSVFFTGMPDFQKELIKNKYGLVPVAAKSPQSQRTYDQIRIGPGGHKIGYSNSKWYDVGTGQEIQ